MRTFIENYLHFIKNCIRPPYKKLKSLKSGIIENSNFENNRDPCQVVRDILLVAKKQSFRISKLQAPACLHESACLLPWRLDFGQFKQFIHNWLLRDENCVPKSSIYLTEQLQILHHPYNPALHYQSQRLIVNIRSLEMLQAQCEDIEITPWYTLCFPRLKCCKENGSGDHNRTDNHHFRCRRLLDSLCVRYIIQDHCN